MKNFYINLEKRAKNKVFWLTLVPALLVLVMRICAIFGVTLDLTALQAELTEIIEAVFVVLAVLGVVVDPTTPGVSDQDGDKNGNE